MTRVQALTPQARKQMASGARARVEHFEWRVVALEQLYEDWGAQR